MEKTMIKINSKYFKENERIKTNPRSCMEQLVKPSIIEKFSLINDESTKRESYFLEESKEEEFIEFFNNYKYKRNTRGFKRGYAENILTEDKIKKYKGL